MKRCWIGLGLMIGLLVCGILTTWGMQRCQDPIAWELEQAAYLAVQDQWQEAESYANQAKEKWESNWGFSASLADHEPMERVNSLFAQLEICSAARDALTYGLLCAQLQEEVEAIGEAHSLVWWNLL